MLSHGEQRPQGDGLVLSALTGGRPASCVEGVGVRAAEHVAIGVGRTVAPTSAQGWETRGVGGLAVGTGTVQARGASPAAGGVAGDVDADLHNQLGADQRDLQRLAGAPPCGGRPIRPRVAAPGRSE